MAPTTIDQNPLAPNSPPSSISSTATVPDIPDTPNIVEYSDVVEALPPSAPVGHPHIILRLPCHHIPSLPDTVATMLFRRSQEVFTSFLELPRGKEFYYIWKGFSFEDELIIAKKQNMIQIGLYRRLPNDPNPNNFWWDAVVLIAIDSEGKWNRFNWTSLCHDEQRRFWTVKSPKSASRLDTLGSLELLSQDIAKFVFEKRCWEKTDGEGGIWCKVVDAGHRWPLKTDDASG